LLSLLSVKFVEFLNALESFGFLITMLKFITFGMRHFLLLVGIIVTAFAMAFHVLLGALLWV
jgi:hypothetical protein